MGNQCWNPCCIVGLIDPLVCFIMDPLPLPFREWRIFSGMLLHFPFLYLKQMFKVVKMLQIKTTFGLWLHQELFWLPENGMWSWFRISSRKSLSPCSSRAGIHSHSCDAETLPPQQLLKLLLLWRLRSLLLLLKLSGVAVEEQVLFVSAGDAGKKIAGILQRPLRTLMGWVTVRLSAVHCLTMQLLYRRLPTHPSANSQSPPHAYSF